MNDPTLLDVARLAGVSPATASRALHSANAQCSQETRARVTEAAQELGYRRQRAQHRRRGVVAYMAELHEVNQRLAAAEQQLTRVSQAVGQLMRERNERTS